MDRLSQGSIRAMLVSSWVGVVGAFAFVLSTGLLVALSVHRVGSFTYALDDAYIHLRLAENLTHGTLGINPGQFAAAASSPIWPLLLAGPILILGPLAGVPLFLNLVSGTFLLVGVDWWARRYELPAHERVWLIAAALLIGAMPLIALTGMEHLLQTGAFFLLVAVVLDSVEVAPLSSETLGTPTDRRYLSHAFRGDLAIAATAALAAATRFEVVFLLVPLSIILLIHRRWRSLTVMLAGSLSPVVVVALVNSGQGWPVLPASVVTKASVADQHHGLARLLPWFSGTAEVHFSVLLILALMVGLWIVAATVSDGRASPRTTRWNAVALVASVLHFGYMMSDGTGRYYVYLVVIILAACAVSYREIYGSKSFNAADGTRRSGSLPELARVGSAALLLIAMVGSIGLISNTVRMTKEIHDQQIQMAAFVAETCPGCVVVVNDIGAVAMYGDVTVLDDFGLASREVLESKLDGTYTTRRLEQMARAADASVAMVYTDPFWIPGVPKSWEPLGSWTIDRAIYVLGGRTVSFFSLDPGRTGELERAFATFPVPGGTTRLIAQPN